MIQIKLCLTLVIFFISGQIYSQSSYLVGTSQTGIEPDQSLISLHLGGYGAPRDGRFTLQWTDKQKIQEVTSFTGMSDKLFCIIKGELFAMKPSENHEGWIREGKAKNIKHITSFDGKLFAINTEGELLATKPGKGIKWEKIGTIDKSVKTIAALDNILIAADAYGSLLSADLSNKNIEWLRHKTDLNIISLAANNRKLYILTNDGTLYQFEPWKKGHKLLKIAYRNGETIKEDIRHITVLNDRIYGIDDDNYLYMGEHRSEGNLTSRAMAINSGKETIIVVNVDICGLTDTFTGSLKEEIFKKTNIPSLAVFINFSHTHFAPVAQDWLTWQEANQHPDSTYLYSTIRNGILNAVDNAIKTMAPAELYFGRGKTDIGYNRSLKDHPELYDNAVDVIKVDYSDNDTEQYLFMAACHPVFSTAGKHHYTISANYPGIARKLVEERTGTNNSLFLQGTAGDINPIDDGEDISGEKLANDVIDVLNKPMERITGPVSFFLDTIDIPITPWTVDEILDYKAQNINKEGDVYAEKNVKWSDLMLRYLEEGTMPLSLPVYVHTINIGNWKLVGFSRETTTGYSFGVKNMWPGKMVSVAGYTNDVSSYLPTHMHIEDRGYEGLDSFFWYGSPNVFPVNVDDIILSEIKDLKR
jgi:hypothetical protein